MKNLIAILIMLVAVGCLTPEQKQKAFRDSVVGEYTKSNNGETYKHVFLENSVYKEYINGGMLGEAKWKIVDGEIHIYSSDFIIVSRINKDKSITLIAEILDGKRNVFSKEYQFTYKKIK